MVLRFSSIASLLEDIYDSSCLRLAPSFTAGVCSGRGRGEMFGSLAAVAVRFVLLLFFLSNKTESSRRAGLLLLSANANLSLENGSRPAVGPEMRDCGMRQLPVMSPRAFLACALSPAVAGRALAARRRLSARSKYSKAPSLRGGFQQRCDGATTTLLRCEQGLFMRWFWCLAQRH